jgi:hypothetical protein
MNPLLLTINSNPSVWRSSIFPDSYKQWPLFGMLAFNDVEYWSYQKSEISTSVMLVTNRICLTLVFSFQDEESICLSIKIILKSLLFLLCFLLLCCSWRDATFVHWWWSINQSLLFKNAVQGHCNYKPYNYPPHKFSCLKKQAMSDHAPQNRQKVNHCMKDFTKAPRYIQTYHNVTT